MLFVFCFFADESRGRFHTQENKDIVLANQSRMNLLTPNQTRQHNFRCCDRENNYFTRGCPFAHWPLIHSHCKQRLYNVKIVSLFHSTDPPNTTEFTECVYKHITVQYKFHVLITTHGSHLQGMLISLGLNYVQQSYNISAIWMCWIFHQHLYLFHNNTP